MVNRIDEISDKLDKIDKNVFPKFCNQIQLLYAMLDNHLNNSYRNFNPETLGSAVVALKYFLSPGDYLPDASLPAGYFDDVEVVTQVMISHQQELEDYIKWKGLNVEDYF